MNEAAVTLGIKMRDKAIVAFLRASHLEPTDAVAKVINDVNKTSALPIFDQMIADAKGVNPAMFDIVFAAAVASLVAEFVKAAKVAGLL